MSPTRLAVLAAALAALALPAAAAPAPPPRAPQGLRAFLLRPDEPARSVFPRTPSFAWQPVAGSRAYEFQLARSRDFADGTILYRTRSLTTPVAAVPLALPWLTGQPHALYARVRAVGRGGTSAWSAPFGFDTSWDTVPRSLPSAPGLVRWTPVAGATGYEVWYPDAGKRFATLTTVADERELYAFHQDARWTGTVRWRVRAVRRVGGAAVSHGPWSRLFVAHNPTVAHAPLRLTGTLGDTARSAYRLTPGFTWSGGEDLRGRYHGLYRVYVFADARCVDVVFRGAVVGSPAYAPRPGGAEPPSFAADGDPVRSSEAAAGATVDLPDSGWPSGRYTWTVVPVESVKRGRAVEYRDVELAQDACARGRRGAFGKASGAPVTSAGAAYAAGLSPRGSRLVAAAGKAPSFYGAPLVAWRPVPGARSYELEASRTAYPWQPVWRTTTSATSALLAGLAPGRWFYRVRGVDPYLPGPAKGLAWSEPQRIELAPPLFSVSRP